MKNAKRFYTFILGSIVIISAACSEKATETPALYVPPVDDPSPTTPPATMDIPLRITLYAKFDLVNYSHTLIFQETGTKYCDVTPSNPVATCTVKVPEGRLYYSSLFFGYSWMPQNCRLMTFQPYYYRMSTAGGFLPPNADSGIDCTKNDAACFGGAAPQLVPDFPKNRALIYLPDENDLTAPFKIEQELKSAYSLKWGSNRHAVNDMPAGKMGNNYASLTSTDGNLGVVTTNDRYVANTMVNYRYSCRDEWYDPEVYVINLNITEEDSNGGSRNDIYTWKELP